jgi:alkylation response protein AidB-like acyl-CoA dehydrogenase
MDIVDDSKFLEEAEIFAANEIRPYATKFDTDEGVSLELIKKMGANGYLSSNFPTKYGGFGLNPLQYGMLTEIIGKACCSTRALLTVNSSLIGESILRFGTDSQKDYWLKAIACGDKIGAFALTEPEVGSNAKGIKTEYRKDGDSFIINGTKKWITYGAIADFYLLIASNSGKATAFLVDSKTEGITAKKLSGLLASKGAYLAEIEFKNVKVSKDSILGIEGIGFTHTVNTALDHGRYSIAWAGVAVAQEALEGMVTYARNREQFGKKIYNFQLIQEMIANAVAKTHASRALCIEAGRLREVNSQDAVIETTMAKYFTSKAAVEITNDAVQLHGGNGCSNQFAAERLFREAKVLEIIEGTSQIQVEILSLYGLRKYYKTTNT